MPESEKQPHRMKAAVILAAGVIMFCLWFFLWSYGVQYWPVFRSLLPPTVYFPIEEILALNDHNSPWCLVGGVLIAAGFIVWAIRANGRKLRIWESALLGLIVVFLLMAMTPCLCAPREIGRRVSCISNLKNAWLELLDKYPDKLPDSFEVPVSRSHTVRYRGAGRSWKEPRFILFEDGSGHAGDLRHRFWSDGKIDAYYPWKEAGK